MSGLDPQDFDRMDPGGVMVDGTGGLDEETRSRLVFVPCAVQDASETMTEPDPRQVGPHIHAKAVRWHRIAQDAFARTMDAGVPIAMGTDSGLTAPHGHNLKELGLMVRFGNMTPLKAIRAATSDAARLCGIDTLTGTLTKGKAADLVICGTDPLADIDALGDPANIHTVIKDGHIAIDRTGILKATSLPHLT